MNTILRLPIFLTLFCLGAVSLISKAADTTSIKKDKLKDINILLFDVMNSDELIEETIAGVTASFEGLGNELTDNQYDDFMDSVMDIVSNKAKKLMRVDMPLIYDKNFTHKEIKDLISFFKTPTGKKYIMLSPRIQEQTMNLMINKYLPEMQDEIMQKYNEIRS